jgi:hypothetical protein
MATTTTNRTNNLPQTKVIETLTVTNKMTSKSLEDKIGRPLGSPINGKAVGEEFTVTLTGKIEIREFQGQKGAYFTSKEGYSIRVNASFDPNVHKEGAAMTCVCRELILEGRPPVKFAAFMN